jgi:flagellar assembly factor FliW
MTHNTASASSAHAEPLDVEADGLQPRPEDVIAFPDGLPGFESCRRFVLVSVEEHAPFHCLQALDGSRPSFLLIDPAVALKRYRRVLSPADRLRLEAREDDTLLWLAIVTLGAAGVEGSDDAASVNLRAPIVINPRVMTGFQVMPHQSLYPLRHPLSV